MADEPLTAQTLLDQSEPMAAAFESIARGLVRMRAKMIEGGVPARVADNIVTDAAHQFVQGTFNKQGIDMSGMFK